MNKIIALFIFALSALLFFFGCSGDGRAVGVSNAVDNYKPELLFETEGCRVYRFYDGRAVYFTNCQSDTQWTESCGKNCSRTVGVKGSK